MIKIERLIFKNFLSYGAIPTEIDFSKPGATLIVGKNGVGKSSIIDALVYALYDKPVSTKDHKDDLVNVINKTKMEIVVDFSVDGHPYRVVRARKMKVGQTGNYVKIFDRSDGLKDITPDIAKHSNDKIQEILKINYDLFVRIVAVSATHKPFLDLPVHSAAYVNQTDIIEELFDLKVLSTKADKLKKQIQDNEKSLERAESEIAFKKKEKETHKKQLTTIELRIDQWERDRIENVANMKTRLASLAQVDLDHQNELHEKKKSLQKEYDKLDKKSKTDEKKMKTLANKIKKLESEIEHLRSDECPYCLQKYPDAAAKVSSLDKERNLLLCDWEEYDEVLREHASRLESLQSEIAETESGITFDANELVVAKHDIKSMQSRIEEAEESINPHLQTLEDIKKNKPARVDMRRVNKLTDELAHQKFLHKLLTRKDSFVRKALLDINIPYLNKQLSLYLDEMELPLAVEFTHNMTAKITKFGNELPFSNMSSGQKSRINLALSFAFRDVIQNLHSKINICMMDEVLDVGLDSDGIQAAIKMLKHRSIIDEMSLFVISHKSEEIDAFDSRMEITIEDGFSKITYQ